MTYRDDIVKKVMDEIKEILSEEELNGSLSYMTDLYLYNTIMDLLLKEHPFFRNSSFNNLLIRWIDNKDKVALMVTLKINERKYTEKFYTSLSKETFSIGGKQLINLNENIDFYNKDNIK